MASLTATASSYITMTCSARFDVTNAQGICHVDSKDLPAGESTEFSVDAGKGYGDVKFIHATYVPVEK